MTVKDPLNYWQDGSITHRSDRFYEFCDALEVKDGKNAPYHGWGLNYAFEAWGRYWNKTLYPSCTFCAIWAMMHSLILRRLWHMGCRVCD